MKSEVFVNNTPVAVLERLSEIEYVMAYRPEASAAQFVSLKMPVRTASYDWHDLHPIFQMNLPEGFLLQVLQEQLGPLMGATPLDLLAVVGRNMIGRIKVAPAGSDPAAPPSAFDVKAILHGDNSEHLFIELVKEYATSGVSGVVPKFLTPETSGRFNKATLATEQYIIKGSSHRLPYVALNEHLAMEVCRRAGFDTAQTEVSEDGQALLVHRFDVAADGNRLGMEDLCSLLSMKPVDKYSTTWEKIIKETKAFVPPASRVAELEKLGIILLLTYALRNADCHSKNISLLYTDRDDVRVSPIYDMLTILAYDSYAKNPPGLMFGGRKTWMPGKALERFLIQHLNISALHQKELIEKIGDAMLEVAPLIVGYTRSLPGFLTTGKNMLFHWNAGLNSLRLNKTISLAGLKPVMDAAGFEDVHQQLPARTVLGHSELLPGSGRAF